MKGTIANFRSSRHRQTDNQMIIKIEGIATRDKAAQLVGKSVVFKTEGDREIKGKVSAPHGNKGAVRALFEKGMPGQSIARIIKII